MVFVHSASFESPEGEAMVSLPESSLVFRAKMKEVQLLEDTSREDMNGSPIFEGDVVRAMVQNEYGSFEQLEGPVKFDEMHWGFLVEFENRNSFELSGLVSDVEIIGNMFDTEFHEKIVLGKEENSRTAHRS